MSRAYKEAVVEAAMASDEAVNVRSLLGAANILNAARMGTQAASADAVSRRVKQDRGLAYFGAGRDAFENPACLHYSASRCELINLSTL